MNSRYKAEPVAGPTAKPPYILFLLVMLNGLAPISLYILVPAVPILSADLGGDIATAQMTVSLFMVGIACSQLIMGPLSDKYGRRPVLLAGFSLMVIASACSIFSATLPELIIARFFQALGGATGMVMSRAIIRDLYDRSRISSTLSLVIAVMMIAQMLSPLTGGLIEMTFGWRSILAAMTLLGIVNIALVTFLLPETRKPRDANAAGGFLTDIHVLLSSRAYIGYMLCLVMSSAIIFVFAGAGPYIVVTHLGRSTAEYGAWFATSGIAYLLGNLGCVRLGPRYSLGTLIWIGLALQVGGALLNVTLSLSGWNMNPAWLFGAHMIVMFGNAFVMANGTAGAISIRPDAAGTASGAMGFLQMGFGSLCSQFGAYAGGHFPTPLLTTVSILILSLVCTASMYLFVSRAKPTAAG